jgi:hypothetical protein
MTAVRKAAVPLRRNVVGLTAVRKVAAQRQKGVVDPMAVPPAAAISSMAQDRVPRQVRTRHTVAAPLVVKAAAIPAARS